MRDYMIMTDNTSDLPQSYIDANHIRMLYLACILDGETYTGDKKLEPSFFYKKMRAGSMPTTSQINPEAAKEEFEKIINGSDVDILYIAFSSGLSGSYGSAVIAADEINETYGERRIVVIDSLAASMGEGLLVHKALQLKQRGESRDAVEKWLLDNRLHLCHNFTVDDLNHLYRGGRVSRATAIIGTLVNVKPILHVDDEGHLINIGKVRGRKRSLARLVDSMEKQMGSYQDQNDIVFISHGDCLEDAEYVASLVKSRFGIDSFLINYVGPTIGAHSGPGTLALFYLGEYR